jgi:hypothetical protein
VNAIDEGWKMTLNSTQIMMHFEKCGSSFSFPELLFSMPSLRKVPTKMMLQPCLAKAQTIITSSYFGNKLISVN